MIQASIYGRLGADPVERQTQGGKAMVTVSIAVNAGRADAAEETAWISVAAFGRNASALARHQKGDLLAAMGSLHRSRFTGRDGQERESWSLTVDSIMSARTVRPAGGRKHGRPSAVVAGDDHHVGAGVAATTSSDDGAPFDDPLPF